MASLGLNELSHRPSAWLQLFEYGWGDNVQWISMIKIAAMLVQQELRNMDLGENMENLWVLCYNGNNDLAVSVSFVKHLQAQN